MLPFVWSRHNPCAPSLSQVTSLMDSSSRTGVGQGVPALLQPKTSSILHLELAVAAGAKEDVALGLVARLCH